MRLSDARILTAISIIGLCGFTLSHGWSIIAFSVSRVSATSSDAAQSALLPWTNVPGVAIAALEASATPVADPRDLDGASKRLDGMTMLLSKEPMSATNWLSFSRMRLLTGQPSDKVISALAMSSITGPNEYDAMLQRAVFGIVQWETLPDEVRKRTITDLSGVILSGKALAGEKKLIEEALSSKSDATRKEITELLGSEGVPAKELLLGELGSVANNGQPTFASAADHSDNPTSPVLSS